MPIIDASVSAILTGFLALHGYSSVPHHEYVDGTDFNQYKTLAGAPHDVHEINDLIFDANCMDQRVAGSAGNLASRFRILLFSMIDVRVFAFWMERACRVLGFLLGYVYHDIGDRR